MGKCSSSLCLLREGPPALEETNFEVDLFDRGSLVRWIEWADIRLLDTNWLSVAPLDVIKNRRQELPPEAFVPASELVARAVPIVALSYGWSDPANPDPEGLYARMLQGFFGKFDLRSRTGFGIGSVKYPLGAALFWDHKSLYQHRLRPDWNGERGTFAQSLIQGRTPAEDEKFRRAMSGMQALYFHARTHTLIAQDVPKGGRNPRQYEDRGWTAMECAGACLSGHAVGLNGLDGLVDSSFCKALVPMSLADFESEVARRVFFREEDRAEVVRMYRNGFAEFVRASMELNVHLGGTESAIMLEKTTRLARALPEFEQLRRLSLFGYPSPLSERSPELDGALDGLARRGCRVLCNLNRVWHPDGGMQHAIGQDDQDNPAHYPPRRQ